MAHPPAARCAPLLLLALAARGTAAVQTATPSPVYWDAAKERWRDIASNPYAAGQSTAYDYAAATVLIAYESAAATFTGTLTAVGMKPNFAYQVKLNGKPTYFWGAAGDDLANERLGLAGRWWLSKIEHATGLQVGGWNSTDAEYQRWKARGFTDGAYDYVFEGYLLFSYFVTDAAGSGSLVFSLDSSFHVLWKLSQRAPTANDSTPTPHNVVAESASAWYDQTYPASQVGLYAEWEPGRPLPGRCSLPLGLYNVRIFITEESFHEVAAGSGVWATVLVHDAIAFLVVPPNRPPTARPDKAATPSDAPVAIPVLANDSDPDGDPLAVAAVTQGARGSVAVNADNTLTYTPAPGSVGSDSFTYTASDGRGGTATATVKVSLARSARPDIFGRITDRATGAGVPGIRVVLWQRKNSGEWEADSSTTTDAQGAYAFTALALRLYRVEPSGKRWAYTPAWRAIPLSSATAHVQSDFTAARNW